MLKEISEAILIGFNPFQTELLWTRMLRESFWGLGGGPVIYAAMSAIDTALWLAWSNYEVIFSPDQQISERVIFPVTENEAGGIEDARPRVSRAHRRP